MAHLASCLTPNSRFYFRHSALQMRISQEYEKVNFRKTKYEIFHSNCFCLEIEWCVTCSNFLHVVCVVWSYKRKFRNEWRLQLPNNDSHWIPDEDLSQKIDILISSTALINILFSKDNQEKLVIFILRKLLSVLKWLQRKVYGLQWRKKKDSLRVKRRH